MYMLASEIIGKPILSLQNGYPVSKVTSILIKPQTLELVALGCEVERGKSSSVLVVGDIRDMVADGIVIDGFDVIEEIKEIVRLQAIADEKFELVGIAVISEARQKLGSVEDYAIDTVDYKVQKLYVKQSILRNLLMNNLVIDRTQVVDVTPKQITVRDASVSNSALAPHPAPQEPA